MNIQNVEKTMAADAILTKSEEQEIENEHLGGGGGGAVYGLGLIGAWVFYFQRVTNFKEGVLAFFTGLVWPAILVYDLLKFFEKEKPPSE
jgi:hypothetical protein